MGTMHYPLTATIGAEEPNAPLFHWPQHDATNCNDAKHMSLAVTMARDTPITQADRIEAGTSAHPRS